MLYSCKFIALSFLSGSQTKPQTGIKPLAAISVTPAPSNKVYQKKDVGEDQNRIVKLASIISNNDLDWITTLNRENGLWTMYRKHPNQNKDGSWDWACGLNSYYHKGIIAQIKAKSISEEEVLKYCYKVYSQRKTAFYGYKTRNLDKDKFYLTAI